MGSKTIVTCDFCSGDLTHDHGSNEYRLELTAHLKARSPDSNVRFAVLTYQPAGGVFCNYTCLLDWLSNGLRPKSPENDGRPEA